MSEMKETVFYCQRVQLRIYCREFLSIKEAWHDKKLPAVLISHGFGGNSNDVTAYCRALADKGYAAYSFDFCGGSRVGEGKSDGCPTDMTIGSECADLQTVLHAVQQLPYIDASRISLMGCSQGGFISALTAAREGSSIDKLVLLFPAFCIPDHARSGRLGGACYDINSVPDVIECPNHMKISRDLHNEVLSMNPFQEAAAYPGRVLIFHGTQDPIVDFSYAVKAQDAYGKERCQLIPIENAGHRFNDEQNEQVFLAIEHFLNVF